MDWHLKQTKTVFASTPFEVEALDFSAPHAHTFYRLRCPDWVNVLPITHDKKALLIKQFRAGPLDWVLEIPGGVVDENERDVTLAAVRELEEETGYTSQRLIPLASINPNQAIMTNKVHYFLALQCTPNAQRQHFPDPSESISTELVEIAALEELVRTGRMDHSLSALCVMLAFKYLNLKA